ncbi:hypothetical protein RQP46_010056 [Phenoliferia psychrophenolica]
MSKHVRLSPLSQSSTASSSSESGGSASSDSGSEAEDEPKTDPLLWSLLGHKSGHHTSGSRTGKGSGVSRRSSLVDKLARRGRRLPLALTTSAVLLALALVALSIRLIFPPTPLLPLPALSSACASNTWRPGLYINCTLSMGLNNLRSEFSQCLKFAFDAGAGLVPPLIVLRNETTLNAWSWGGGEFDRPGEWELHFSTGTYRKHVDYLIERAGLGRWSPDDLVIIHEPLRPYAVWDYRSQPAPLTHAFFDLIDWAPRLREIGNGVASHPLLQNGYIGVHLRLEKDVIETWAGFDAQSSAYATYIHPRPERVIFLASGDASFKAPFAALFPEHTVVDKWDLMPEGEEMRARADELNFDELGVLDYMTMKNASLVLGIGLSSFAYLLGVDRREPGLGHFSDTLHMELFPAGSTMVGDERTLLLPPILPEYYISFP